MPHSSLAQSVLWSSLLLCSSMCAPQTSIRSQLRLSGSDDVTDEREKEAWRLRTYRSACRRILLACRRILLVYHCAEFLHSGHVCIEAAFDHELPKQGLGLRPRLKNHTRRINQMRVGEGRELSFLLTSIQPGALCYEQSHYIVGSPPGSPMQRGFSVVVDRVDVITPFEAQLDRLEGVLVCAAVLAHGKDLQPRREHQRGSVTPGCDDRIGAMLDKQAHHLVVYILGRQQEWSGSDLNDAGSFVIRLEGGRHSRVDIRAVRNEL